MINYNPKVPRINLKPLTLKEELTLGRKIEENKYTVIFPPEYKPKKQVHILGEGKKAANTLAKHYINLLSFYANKFSRNTHSIKFDEYFSKAQEVLIAALGKYDTKRNCKFSTLLYRMLPQGLGKLTKSEATRFKRDKMVIEKIQENFENSLSREYTDPDTLKQTLENSLGCLDSREEYVIKARYGINGFSTLKKPLTLKEVGEELGLTKERVRQIQNTALAKIRTRLPDDKRSTLESAFQNIF